MNRKFPWLVLIFTIILVAIQGCHGNPSTPDPGLILGDSQNLAQGNQLNHLCLGSYDVSLDPLGMEAEILPNRSSDLHLNLTKIFVNTLNLSIALIPGESDPPNGVFAVDFTITHPFTAETEYTIFDVKGIVMTPGTFNIGSAVFTGPAETRVDNADGYTRWWNPGEFTQPGIFGYMDGLFTNTTGGLLTANINPYKYFADILDPTDGMQPVYSELLTSDNGRGVFKTGSSNTRRYIVKFQMLPSPDFRFSYVIDGCWAIPDPNPPSAVPDDFPIQANQPEAFHLALAKKADTLYYSSNSGTGAGIFKLQVNVHDWQGQHSGDIASQVGSVKVYAPDLFPGGIEMAYLDQTPVKARYTVDLTGIAIPTEAGETLLAVEVVSSGGPAYDQGLSYPAPAAPIAAWQTLILDIPDLNCHSDANNDFADAFEINYGSTIDGQVCLPDDYRDFYFFEIPSGFEVSGHVDLHCDAGPTKLGLYDPDQNLIIETDVTAGFATIDVDSLNLMPDTYYLRIYTSNPTELAPYELDFKVTATDVTPNPVALTGSGLYVNPHKIWWEGDYIYLLNSRFLWIYDITIPSNPVQVFKKRGSFGPKTLSAHYGNFIYYISYPEPELGQINMIDVSNPVSPQDLGRLEVLNQAGMIFIDGDYLYTGEFSFGYQAIKIVNISDPGNIFLETEYLTSLGKVNFLAYDNGRMAALVGTNGWEFLNVSNPALITQIASGSLPNPTRTMNIYNDYLYITTEAGSASLHIFELNMFDPPVLVNAITLPGTNPSVISFYEDYMIIPSGNLEIYSLLNPALPNHVATYIPSNVPTKAIVQNDIMYIAALDRIEIVDASNMLNPTFINSVLLTSGPPSYLMEIEVDGQFAYASGLSPAYLCNVWPPEEAVNLGILFGDHGYYTTDMVIVDDLIYLASMDTGLSIYDLY